MCKYKLVQKKQLQQSNLYKPVSSYTSAYRQNSHNQNISQITLNHTVAWNVPFLIRRGLNSQLWAYDGEEVKKKKKKPHFTLGCSLLWISQTQPSMRVTHYALQSGFSTTLTTILPIPVFWRTPPQPVYIWPSSQTSFLWHSTTLTGVCPKWRPQRMLRDLWHSETAFPSAAFWQKGAKTSHRGLSQVNMVGGWPAEHHWWLDSPESQLLCTRWHCHDGAVDHGHPFRDATFTMPGRI